MGICGKGIHVNLKNFFNLQTIWCVACNPIWDPLHYGCLVVLLVFHRKPITPQMAACICKLRVHIVTADGFRVSPVSHPAWWPYLTNVDSINMSDRMAFHMPWFWHMTCLTFRNSWRRSRSFWITSIACYRSWMPMILSDSFVNLAYSVYSSLKTAFFNQKNRTLKLYWFVRYCHLPAAIFNIWHFSRIPGWGQSNIENAGWNEAETVKKH